jgi:hypothetical protein
MAAEEQLYSNILSQDFAQLRKSTKAENHIPILVYLPCVMSGER